jgi:hypothetical protein
MKSVVVLAVAASLLSMALVVPLAADEVKMNVEEAELVLSILERRAGGAGVDEESWSRLFASEPYVRLKRREASMNRAFTDESFREFVRSPELASRAADLRETLERWRSVDLASPIERAKAYLPEGATIRVTVYPVIKPMTNSFVFEIDTDPAIFLYLDPDVSPEKLSNTLAHEFHHIGFGSHCPTETADREIDQMPDNVSWVVRRLGAFGEGFAMLAAAGGLEIHPHEASDPADRARWDRDVSRAAEDMAHVAAFLEGSLDGTLTDEEKGATFRSFYGEQGPWYTVGWLMSATIERQLGRDALIAAFCDTRTLLETYNAAAAVHASSGKGSLPTWPEPLVRALREGKGGE